MSRCFPLVDVRRTCIKPGKYHDHSVGLTIGQTAQDDQAKVRSSGFLPRTRCILTIGQAIVKTAFDNGINMFDTAETYANGQSEIELSVFT